MKVQNDSVSLLQFLVQNMLDYAQIKAGNLRKNITEFSIKTCIEKVINIQKIQADSKGLEINTFYHGFTDDLTIYSDEQRIAQVLLCLVSNAIKFTFEG